MRLSYLIKRILLMIPQIIGITIISFAIIHLAPGEPTGLSGELNPKITKEARERLRHYYGLDSPLHVQYLKWFSRVARMDFGESFGLDHRPVMDKVIERLPITIIINTAAMLIILATAIPIGVISAYLRGSFFDRSTTLLVYIGFATPSFWLAILLMMLFGVKLGWFPISGLATIGCDVPSAFHWFIDRANHLVLPLFVAVFGGVAGFSRYMRSNMLDALSQDYVRTARAKGCKEQRVLFTHAMRNALLPVITLLGLSVPALMSGSVIFETIFAIPGMGQLMFQSVMARDYPVIMAVLVLSSFLTLLGNLLADLGYALTDPRIKIG